MKQYCYECLEYSTKTSSIPQHITYLDFVDVVDGMIELHWLVNPAATAGRRATPTSPATLGTVVLGREGGGGRAHLGRGLGGGL